MPDEEELVHFSTSLDKIILCDPEMWSTPQPTKKTSAFLEDVTCPKCIEMNTFPIVPYPLVLP